MKTSYIFNLNKKITLAQFDYILIQAISNNCICAEIDMAEGDYLWLRATDPLFHKWANLCKEEIFDRVYVNIDYSEWDDPQSFIDNVKSEIEELSEEPAEEIDEAEDEIEEIKEAEDEVEILETVNSVNDEIEAIEYSNKMIEIEAEDKSEDEVVIEEEPSEVKTDEIKKYIKIEIEDYRSIYWARACFASNNQNRYLRKIKNIVSRRIL